MSKATILVIDDDPIILEMLGVALGRYDYHVLYSEDGDKGLHIFKEESPDLVIIDIAMPGIDGYEVVERIRSLGERGKTVPLVILTAHDQTVMRTYAKELGANLYLTKPVTPKDLVSHLETLLA